MDNREHILAKIAKYKQMIAHVDELTADRIRSLIEDLERVLEQTKQRER